MIIIIIITIIIFFIRKINELFTQSPEKTPKRIKEEETIYIGGGCSSVGWNVGIEAGGPGFDSRFPQINFVNLPPLIGKKKFL
jgi:hypothetical protein